jgi:putative SOS response-associated peptidase YedK
MCSRFLLVDTIELLKTTFNATFDGDYKPSYNISSGQLSLVITDTAPHHLQQFQFGLTPFFAKKQTYLTNARAEGDHNKENNPGYNGAKGIIITPAFRKPIRSQRCLVIASAFITGTTKEGLNKPYLVYLKKRPFAFAGIWDTWKDPETEATTNSFAIITITANKLLQAIPHHRMPVILPEASYRTWLNPNTPLSTITKLLGHYPAEQMNAYPISADIKDTKNNYKKLLNPTGERLFPEFEDKVTRSIKTVGYGGHQKSRNPEEKNETLGDRNNS